VEESGYYLAAMAITSVDYSILRKLHDMGAIPPRPSVLELGEAEWYGDVGLPVLSEAIDDLVEDEEERERLHQRMAEVVAANAPTRAWDLAKVFYGALFRHERLVAIDFHGSETALKIDLNYPVDLNGERFDVVNNGGTAEHVFDVCQFFRTMHDITRAGGLMIHHTPFQGWLEHGFYNFNTGFFWDLAAANDYTVVLFAYAEIKPPRIVELTSREQIISMELKKKLGRNSISYVVFRKGAQDGAFRIPRQAVYSEPDALSDYMHAAWHQLR